MKYLVTLHGKDYEVEVEKGEVILVSENDTPAASAAVAVPSPVVVPAIPPSAAPVAAGPGEPVVSPLPGTVLSVKVNAGMSVKKGDLLLVIEAMKMENDVLAPRDGNIGTVLCKSGGTVNTGDPLLTLL